MTDTSKEAAIISSTPEPRTRAGLARDLRTLGVEAGTTLLVHASLSRLGWTVGGPESVIAALMDVLTAEGTLVMPTFSGQLTDPEGWRDPAVPPAWHQTIREQLPAFDPARTPTRDMGAIAEAFRTWPGVRRSHHPIMSFAAWGRHGTRLVADHGLDWPLGNGSPLGTLYRLDGQVLLLGVDHRRNSSLHLAETRARHRRTVTRRVPVARGDGVDWVEIQDVVDDLGRLFPQLGQDFEATGAVRVGPVGAAECRLMAQRTLVDFASPWFDETLQRTQVED